MTENEAREILKIFDRERKEHMTNMPHVPYFDRVACDNFTQSLSIAIESLKEIQRYRSIGTVEECRAAVEKQRAKKPIWNEERAKRIYLRDYSCPCCGSWLINLKGIDGITYCETCGTALDWTW